jgi:hypothetical protein
MKTDKQEQYKENRERLISLSLVARELVKMGEFDRVNEAIIEGIYKEESPEIEDFKTFGQWKHEGKTIIKGSKAFLVWGQPRKVEQTPEGSTEPSEYKYWPLCYLFSNMQVK